MKTGTFKLLSVITFACFLFPIFDLLDAFLIQRNIGYTGLIGGIIVAVICLFLANLFNAKNKGIAFVTAVIVSGLLSVATKFITDAIVSNVIVIFIYYFIGGYVGFRAFCKDLTETLSKTKIVAFSLIMLGAVVVTGLKFSFLVNEMIVSFVIAAIASMFVLNRSLLEGLYRRKSSDASDVSKVVQKYNLFFIFGFTLVFVVLFFAKDLLAFLIQYGAALAGLGMLGALKKANDQSFNYDQDVIREDANLKIPQELVAQKAQWADKMNSIMFTAAMVILAIVVIFILYKLIRYAPKKIQLFIQMIKNFFSRIFGLNMVGSKVSSEDFVDEVEDIDAGDLDADRKLRNLQNQKKVRAIKDPVERMRAFYAYFMNTLKKNNVPLFVSDTSYQIYDKSHMVCDMEDITKQVTEMYNEVRYNDSIPNDKMLESVDHYMSEITKNCKAIKIEDDKKDKKKGKR